MIIVKKTGYLKYKNFKFRCALGKNGIKKKLKEGDNITPKGKFKILKIYYRKDKIKNFKSSIKKVAITKKMGWCNDPKSKHYNKQISLPSKFGHEKLFRNDNIYNIVAVLSYNMRPIVKKKGSAIFIHIANKNYKKTHGCLTLEKSDLINLLISVKKSTKVNISSR